MKACYECGHQVAETAKLCPSCGAQKPGEPALLRYLSMAGNAMMGIGCLIILVPLLIVLALAIASLLGS